jgi:hypothetical protein
LRSRLVELGEEDDADGEQAGRDERRDEPEQKEAL